ncbi:succinate dehydrogenase cytochrome b subunit [Haloferula sp.]|uniref:succinate dehydrogenase cytochrome b subunit n=1 Tax=Haloferula sp. TaxID=2497595 RepID=UPI003C76FE77
MSDSTRSCPTICRIWTSSIGRKMLVALTGLGLVFFLLGHLVGNLLVFAGPEMFNDYAEFLHNMLHGMGIWLFRIGMLAIVAIHIAATISLTRENRAARDSYEYKATIQMKRSSGLMIWSGLTILAFIVYHLLHFTAKVGNTYGTDDRYFEEVNRNGEMVVRPNAWQMVIDGFSVWYVVLFYAIAMALLCSHLSHGVQSMFQTLGLRSRKTAGALDKLSSGYAWFILVGFLSIPISILVFGFGR